MLSAPSKYKPEKHSKADITQDKDIHVQSSNKFQTLSKICMTDIMQESHDEY